MVVTRLCESETISRFGISLSRERLSISFPHKLMFLIRFSLSVLHFVAIISRVNGFRKPVTGVLEWCVSTELTVRCDFPEVRT